MQEPFLKALRKPGRVLKMEGLVGALRLGQVDGLRFAQEKVQLWVLLTQLAKLRFGLLDLFILRWRITPEHHIFCERFFAQKELDRPSVKLSQPTQLRELGFSLAILKLRKR